jgi:hypothetical protein
MTKSLGEYYLLYFRHGELTIIASCYQKLDLRPFEKLLQPISQMIYSPGGFKVKGEK